MITFKRSAAMAVVLCFFVCGAFGQADEGKQQAGPKKEFANSLVPGFQGGGFYLFRDQVFYWGGEARFDFAYMLDRNRPSARASDRGRSEIYAAVGLYYSPRSDAQFLFQYLIGFNVSFETPSTLGRGFLIPYLGLAAGGTTIKDRGTGFTAMPVFGLNLVSLERFSLSLEAGLMLATVAFEEFLSLKGSLAMVFVL
jgi:hypothetical protein